MFTYKFLGLDREDAETPYYYGSLPKKPELGHIIQIEPSKNRYVVVEIQGRGLEGEGGYDDQKELAFADIGARKSVPTLGLQKLKKGEKPSAPPVKVRGNSFDPDEMKRYSQQNRKRRLSPRKKS